MTINLANYKQTKKKVREACVNEALEIIKAEAQSGREIRIFTGQGKENPVITYADWIEEALEVKDAEPNTR